MKSSKPIVGNWYQDTELGTIFEVVACDHEEETIEIQLLDGEVAEYDFESWQQMPLRAVAPPEDWRTGFELSDEDSTDPDEPMHPEDWSGAVNQIEPDESGMDDDWQE